MAELWLDIDGFQGLYQVSSYGRVRSFDRITSGGQKRKGRILKPVMSDRYATVNLYSGGEQYTLRIHRLVMNAFAGMRPKGMEINHRNGDRADNRLCNLEYVTHTENVNHARRIGLTPIVKRSKLSEGDVQEIRRLYKLGGYIYARLGEMFGVRENQIGRIIRGEVWKHI